MDIQAELIPIFGILIAALGGVAVCGIALIDAEPTKPALGILIAGGSFSLVATMLLLIVVWK